MAKQILDTEDMMSCKQARAFAKRFAALNLWQTVRYDKRMFSSGYEVRLSDKGSYERIARTNEEAKELLRIYENSI